MQNKNPQGNFDPNPDSDQELEKYGVWVKAEPQDLVEEPETDHQPLIDEDAPSLETMEELSGEIEELAEMQDFDEADGDTFEELASFEDEELSPFESGSEEPESIDLSDFGLDEPVDTIAEDQGDETTDLDLDMDLDEALSTDTVSDEETDFEFDLPEETGSEASLAFDADELEPIDTERGNIDSGLESLMMTDDSEDLMPEIEMENIEMEDEPIAHSFDDVGALQEDLASDTPSDNSVSSDLLQKIALELSSIKEELVSLRSQLGELKREPVPAGMEATETEEDGTKGGFFDDEDDDTIALTGDELDNILNTADFTVEPPHDLTTPDILEESEVFEVAEGFGETESSNLDLMEESHDLLPEDGSYLSTEANETSDYQEEPELAEAMEPGIEAIEGEEALDLDFEIDEEKPTIELDPEINAITEPPEDTSYLDEESSDLSDGFELDASPLEEVPLIEPDLTELDLGIEIDDAIAAESTEDLPFMESADADEGDLILELDEADDDIVLSIDGDEQPEPFDTADFSESLDEIEEVEPLSMDPFEDETISELELHREGPRQADGSWSSEPEDLAELEETVELEETAELDAQPTLAPEAELEPEAIEDFESMDFEGEGLLGSQEVEDLGGEDLETLEEIEDIAEADEFEADEFEAETTDFEPDLETEELPAEEPEDVLSVDEMNSQEIQETEETVPDKLKQDVKSVLLYLDQLLASLPEEKIEEFASSEYYDTYKKLFEDLGLL